MNRYKPVGWRNESYRHYLAAKGIKTKYDYLSGKGIAIGIYASKSPEVERFIDKAAMEQFGRTRTGAIKGKVCVSCGQPVGSFRDSASSREYGISGLCQSCQDDTFDYQMKYMSLKDFLGEDSGDKEAFLSSHKLDGEGHMLRHRDIDSVRQRAIARLDKAMQEGNMTGVERERFLKDDFKSTAQEYLNGYISKDQFDDEINRELDWHLKVNRRNLSPFDWANKPKEEVK